MLVIISDIHLGGGTCGISNSESAFDPFTDRLRELAFNAASLSDAFAVDVTNRYPLEVERHLGD